MDGDWDIVILQEQCAFAVLNEEAFCTSTQTFDEVIRKAGAQTALFMLWGYKDDPAITNQRVAVACTRISERLDLPVIPVGLAWDAVARNRPELDLYLFDGMRANLHGRYLTANVFYAALFGESPEGLAYIPAPPGVKRVITAEEAHFLQRIAWETVQAYP
ncbi:MAG TPA: hypothetical protein P5121_14740 [Caldilineaceae bacterium]|nr:hypothetical protein [Caldilineaceae bacterium]